MGTGRGQGGQDDGAASRRGGLLRREAGCFKLDALHEHQKEAAGRLVDILEDAVGDLRASKEPREPPRQGAARWLDLERQSRVVFLSGPRGSGKTTVLLSVVHAAEDSIGDSPLPAREEPTPGVAARLEGKLRRFAQDLVWLEPIDMDPTPAPTSFLAAVLSRLEDAASPWDERGGVQSPRLHAELAKLRRDATLAWDSNLTERRQRLDLDAYVADVARTERARLGLGRRMADFIRELGGVFPPGRRGRKLFVLTIDDFDLSPTKAIEMVEIVRFLSVPGLLVIALGDFGVASDMFRIHLGGQVAGLGGGASDELRGGALAHTSTGEIAANALRKMVPPSQRIFLSRLALREAAEFAPPRDARSLRDLLDRITLEIATAPFTGDGENITQTPIRSFRSFLLVEGIRRHDGGPRDAGWTPAERPTETDKAVYSYHGAELLAAPARHVLDLWRAFLPIAEAVKTSDEARGKRVLY